MRDFLSGVAVGLAVVVTPMVGLIVFYRRDKSRYRGQLAMLA